MSDILQQFELQPPVLHSEVNRSIIQTPLWNTLQLHVPVAEHDTIVNIIGQHLIDTNNKLYHNCIQLYSIYNEYTTYNKNQVELNQHIRLHNTITHELLIQQIQQLLTHIQSYTLHNANAAQQLIQPHLHTINRIQSLSSKCNKSIAPVLPSRLNTASSKRASTSHGNTSDISIHDSIQYNTLNIDCIDLQLNMIRSALYDEQLQYNSDIQWLQQLIDANIDSQTLSYSSIPPSINELHELKSVLNNTVDTIKYEQYIHSLPNTRNNVTPLQHTPQQSNQTIILSPTPPTVNRPNSRRTRKQYHINDSLSISTDDHTVQGIG